MIGQIFLFGLCWGSFLNVLATRLLKNESVIAKRSYCPHCLKTLAWYDLIPVVSWVILRARCRHCQHKISYLYPLIELFTAATFVGLWYYVPSFFFSYCFFVSCLIISIRTDLEHMVLIRLVTLYTIPIAFFFSYFNYIPLSLIQSIVGAGVGYMILWIIKKLHFALTQKEGLGDGDLDLLAMIGAWTGITGCWVSLLIGSILGSLIGILFVFITNTKHIRTLRIPFGPFLALGSISYILFGNLIPVLL